MTIVEAVLSAAVVVLLGVVGWESLARRRDRRADVSEVAKLRKAQSGQKAQITEIQGALGITGEGETPDVVGEMRVIRGLLKNSPTALRRHAKRWRKMAFPARLPPRWPATYRTRKSSV